MAAGDLVGDDLDTILDQYRVQNSTLGLLTKYLAGEKDSSLNLNNLKKQLKKGERKSAFGVEIPMPLFVSFRRI